MRPEAALFPDAESLAMGAAERVGEAARAAVDARGRFALALSGGRTPQRLYQLLAEGRGGPVDWSKVHVFWGDERCVPPDDPDSNYGMAWWTLLDHVPIPPDHVHRMRAEDAPDRAAASYEADLRAFFGGPSAFDLVLLGLGPDGHTASLFPGSEALNEPFRWALPSRAPEGVEPAQRLTLTLPALNAAMQAMFLVTGAEKASVVTDILTDLDSAAARYPAARVRPAGRLLWLLDEAAAKGL